MATIEAPDRTLAQRREALDEANAARTGRAALKLGVKLGLLDPIDAIRNPPPYARRMHVDKLLLAIAGVGPKRCYWMLRVLGVSPRKTLGGLTEGQRDRLIAQLQRSEAAGGHGRGLLFVICACCATEYAWQHHRCPNCQSTATRQTA